MRYAAPLLLVATITMAAVGDSFVNWETPHVSPLDMTPSGARLLAVNTADNRLEVFEITDSGLSALGAIPVGLDPVSVRARTDTEVWVVNHISDSISIIDLEAFNVVATLHPGDEPTDVVFAGKPQRAFVTVSQLSQIKVYDPADLSAAPITLDIDGEDPRALATDGSTVYAAIFESGNKTTSINSFFVSIPGINPYPGDPNPPPNDPKGDGFDPPLADGLPTPPRTALTVRENDEGQWLDEVGGNWSGGVFLDLADHDVAIIDADGLTVDYATGLMNLIMAISVQPGVGATVVGTEATNEFRFEPNINGTFVRVMGANTAGAGEPVDLNPHLDYSVSTVGQGVRDLSIGDPRGIEWTSAGNRGYVTGMGSNNVLVVDGAWSRQGLIEVGEGPTGVRIDEAHDRLYVLNKFDGSISIIDAIKLGEIERMEFFDPTPPEITDGRPFLYDTHRTSGLGQVSCASCHVDGRLDHTAWDLGNPQGEMKEFNQECFTDDEPLFCEDWHPMKGPMVTQTLIGIIGTEPFHWRGDKNDLSEFNVAFEFLQGDDVQLSRTEMDQFTTFVSSLTHPPNPFRNIDGSLASSVGKGNAANGRQLFASGDLAPPRNCIDCHADPAGTIQMVVHSSLDFSTQSIDSPQLRNLYDRTGRVDFFGDPSTRGFGFLHAGTTDTLFNFLVGAPDFTGFENDQERHDVVAYLMSFSTDTHAGVGVQVTRPSNGAQEPASVAELIAIASSGDVGLVAKGIVEGQARGYYLLSTDTFQSDRAAEQVETSALLKLAGQGAELTFTLVPAGSAIRIGVDRDEDGAFDRDELDAGTDPADPNDTPGLVGDLNGDGTVDGADLIELLGGWGPCDDCVDCPADLDGDCTVGANDLIILLGNWD